MEQMYQYPRSPREEYSIRSAHGTLELQLEKYDQKLGMKCNT